MKTGMMIIIILISAIMILCSCGYTDIGEAKQTTYENEEYKYKIMNYENVKAIWLSQYDLYKIYRDGDTQRDKDDFRVRTEQVMDNIQSLGINTVIVQLRPNGDSLYASDLFPASEYAVGEYGRSADYDPFEIILHEAHARSLSVHGWVNPFRCMKSEKISLVGSEYILRRWYDGDDTRGKYIVEVDGTLYLNPAYPDVRRLIIDGACEIAEKYDVDGIHMDDYFYPTIDAGFDSEVYGEYRSANGQMTLAEYRRDAVSTLVRDMYSSLKDVKKELQFGISPGGNMDTNYNTLYADVEKWCSESGYIDYICPQVYFGFEHNSCPFDGVCREFSDMVKCDSVKLIIGMTLGKAYSAAEGKEDVWAGSGKYEWLNNSGILRRCLDFTKTLENCSGVAFFSYQYFYEPLSGKPVPETQKEITAFLPVLGNAAWN